MLLGQESHLTHDNSHINLPLEDIQWHIDSAYKSFARVKKEPLWRDTWLAGLIAAQAETTNRSKQVLWKQLHSNKQAQEMVCAVCGALQDQWHTPGLLFVIGPRFEGGGRQEFTTKVNLEWACIEEAGRQFTQALDTPLLVDPFLHLFGETGASSSHFQQVLSSSFQSPAICNPFSALLLHHLYHPALVLDLPPCSLKAYASSWQKARESTSSSPSGIHFGHYMAGTYNPDSPLECHDGRHSLAAYWLWPCSMVKRS